MKHNRLTQWLTGLLLVAASTAQASGDYTHFSFALAPDAALSMQKSHQLDSQAYWFTTTGKALRKGVSLHTTAPGAMILVSVDGEQQASRALAVDQLYLTSKDGSDMAARRFSADSLANVGLYGNAVAMQSRDDALPGTLLLRSHQTLADDQRVV
ncbi:hypothetical protein LJ739_17220 [Aestuariibacter halophilus]|uniref:DUF4785 domain-containing protein n=1 Tax=Fluctibacter halophilus TaxID=226011 RepID=A0ABS8GBX4_9ALTE|nr:DUF4785 domain-containing protein [Aestuariibacter halophilus]MCC2617998.1 hypothetical protein [Aestuariibacter halophilus]